MLTGWKLFWAAPNWDISFVTSSFSLGFVKLWSTDGNENETKNVVTDLLKGMKCCLDQRYKSVLVWYECVKWISLSMPEGIFILTEWAADRSDCTYQIRLSTVFKNLNLTNPSWPESPAGWRFPRRDQVEFKFRNKNLPRSAYLTQPTCTNHETWSVKISDTWARAESLIPRFTYDCRHASHQ